MTDSPANPTPDDRVTALWDLHFRDPEPAFAQAQALLAEPANVDARTRAWCELTIAFHHLFFTAHPLEAKRWIAAATDSFAKTGERRGALLAEIGRRTPRDRRALANRRARPPARALPDGAAGTPAAGPVLAAECARCRVLLRRSASTTRSAISTRRWKRCGAVELSPQLPTVMSNLAAALVTVGDYAPARELAAGRARPARELQQRAARAVRALQPRRSIAAASASMHERWQLIERMLADAPVAPRRAAQNHYMRDRCRGPRPAWSLRGRRTLRRNGARDPCRAYPGGYNEVHCAVGRCRASPTRSDDRGRSLAVLTVAAEAAERHRYLPDAVQGVGAGSRSGMRNAGDFEAAYDDSRKLLAARPSDCRIARAPSTTCCKFEHELAPRTRRARPRRAPAAERPSALNRQLERLNTDLSAQDDREVEALQAQLAVEAVHDPLTSSSTAAISTR